MGMTIEIIDNTTGRPPSAKLIARIAKEYGLMEMDIDQFAVTEDGHVVLIDDCGNCSYVDTEGFNLRVNFCEVEDGMTNKQKYLYACKYAIEQLRRKGSCSLAMDIHSDNPIVVKWKDVIDWIDEEYDNDEKYEVEDGNEH